MPRELPITGYVDRLSRRPGERVRAHVSVCDDGAYRARLVRVLSADANPNGPGVRFADLAQYFDENFNGERHAIHRGSYLDAPGPSLSEKRSHTWTALMCPGLLPEHPCAVLSHESECNHLTLSLTRDGVRVEVTTVAGPVPCDLCYSIRKKHWYRVWVSVDELAGRVVVGVQPATDHGREPMLKQIAVSELRLPSGGRMLVAARNFSNPQGHFDGKIEDPALLDGCWESWADPLARFFDLTSAIRAGWDFSLEIPTQCVLDVGPHRLHGTLMNVPTRAVRGARWRGEEMRWSQRPQEYAAIHFHSDDLGDCEWPVAFEFCIPRELSSGSYAFHLSCAAGEDWLPFYVLPPRGGPYARIAFLAPTFTYQAYANLTYGKCNEAFRNRVHDWAAYPFDPEDYPAYGTSTYNKHPDGSGVMFASRLRPMLCMRPGFITFLDTRGSGSHHYAADAHLLAWLESRGFAFDVLTDEDLHEEGASLLAPYAAVLTGTHPEYHTACTLDAIRGYLQAGGRLAYLGGNGFYWKIGRNDDVPGIIEIRRAEGGTRTWAAEPGEYYHATDGAYGGLWRRNGRNPQELVGVGFGAQGPFEGTHYVRTLESYGERVAWIFEGVEGEILGDYGLSGGGAAGYELDRADAMLGTPGEAIVLARSAHLPESFGLTLEEILWGSVTVSGEPAQSLIRADMIYFETPAGGAVFSAGSITFCGSLWRSGFEGPVSRLLENIICRFAAIDHPKSI